MITRKHWSDARHSYKDKRNPAQAFKILEANLPSLSRIDNHQVTAPACQEAIQMLLIKQGIRNSFFKQLFSITVAATCNT